MPDPSRPRPFIRASDVGRYAYCARAWWLATVKGVATDAPRLAAGSEAHMRHGRRVQSARWQVWLGLACLLLASILLLILALR